MPNNERKKILIVNLSIWLTSSWVNMSKWVEKLINWPAKMYIHYITQFANNLALIFWIRMKILYLQIPPNFLASLDNKSQSSIDFTWLFACTRLLWITACCSCWVGYPHVDNTLSFLENAGRLIVINSNHFFFVYTKNYVSYQQSSLEIIIRY